MTNEAISLNEEDEDRLQELVSDYVSESPKSRTESLVRKLGFMDISELSLNSLEDFSYYCVTRMNGKGEIRDLLEYLLKKDPSTWNRQQYYGLIEKYSPESGETTSKENIDIKEPKNSEQKQTKKKVPSQKTRDKKRSLTHSEKVWVWENKTHKCYVCGKEVEKFSEANFDHTKPHAKGWKTTPANSGITHILCNKLKGKKSLKEIQKHLGIKSGTEGDTKKSSYEPTVQIVNTGVEPPDPANPQRTKYHPNLRNDGTVPVSDIRMYYKIMNRVVDLADIIREKSKIRKTYIPYEGSILPNGSARVNPIDLERTEKEISVVFWIDYDYGENESSEIIFNVQFKNFQNTRVILYDHSVIAKAERELDDIKSGKRSAPI